LVLDLRAAGVLPESIQAWRKLIVILKQSDEYRVMGGIDIGRFVALTLCASNHYYALTGTTPSFQAFRAAHPINQKKFAVIQSAVALGNRLIEIGTDDMAQHMSFTGYEGTGSLTNGTFQPTDIETMSTYPNGQLHFALYTMDGVLEPAAPPALTHAGKPSKCIWCHGSTPYSAVENVTEVSGYYSNEEFTSIIYNRNEVLSFYRQALAVPIDFTWFGKRFAEFLYLAFYFPTEAHLAQEWGMSVQEIHDLLKDVPVRPFDDVASYAEYYAVQTSVSYSFERENVEQFTPYNSVRAPTSARDQSKYEPDLLTE